MTLDWQPILVGGLAVSAAGIQLSREAIASRGRRSRIKADLEILGLMPTEMPQRDLLATHIGEQVANLVERERELRRDWYSIVLGAVFVLIGLGLTAWVLEQDNWVISVLGLAAAAFCLLLGAVGIGTNLTPKRPDEIRSTKPRKREEGGSVAG